jgi:hypothetical protein
VYKDIFVRRSPVLADLLSKLPHVTDSNGSLQLAGPGSSDECPIVVDETPYDFNILMNELYGNPM